MKRVKVQSKSHSSGKVDLPPSNSNLTAQEAIDLALKHEKEEKGIETITRLLVRAVKSCECQFLSPPHSLPPSAPSTNPRVACTCRDFIAAAELGQTLSLSNKPCTCPAKRWKTCSNAVHQKGLVLLLQRMIKLSKYDKALEIVRMLLEINPRHPDGFLGLAQILRHQAPHDLKVSAKALNIYRNGLEVFPFDSRKDFAIQHDALSELKLKMETMCMEQRKCDFMPKFPVELVELVFQSFNATELSVLLRVSKSWYWGLHSSPWLWRHLHFLGSRKEPTMTALNKLVARSKGTVCSLALERTRWLRSENSRAKFRDILRYMPALENLWIDDVASGVARMENAVLPNYFPTFRMKHLTNLHLGPGVAVGKHLMDGLVNCIGTSITTLTVLNLRCQIHTVSFERPGERQTISWLVAMPNLQHLRLRQGLTSVYFVDKALINLAASTTNLKQLVLEIWHDPKPSEFSPPSPREIPHWPLLEVMILEVPNCNGMNLIGGQFSLPKLKVLKDDQGVVHLEQPRPQLRYLHLGGMSFHGRVAAIHEIVRGNTLEVLSYSEDKLDLIPIADIKRCTNVKVLVLSIRYWNSFTEQKIMTVTTILQALPSVNTLAVLSEAAAAEPIGRALLHRASELGKINTIHEQVLSGTARDHFYTWARSKNITVTPIAPSTDLPVVPIDLANRDWTRPFVRFRSGSN